MMKGWKEQELGKRINLRLWRKRIDIRLGNCGANAQSRGACCSGVRGGREECSMEWRCVRAAGLVGAGLAMGSRGGGGVVGGGMRT